MQIEDIEKLGAFYLGRVVDDAGLNEGKAGGPLLLDSRALTTHAVCIGMTGSGKTGLCTALLEEAAIDGVGAIIVDPKGDLGGLACAFDVDVDVAKYAEFVDPFEARRAGKSVDEAAAGIAAMWKQGLIDTLQTPARVQRFRDAVDVRLYTPGASHGHALSLVKSFAAPSPALLSDVDGWRQRLQAQASGLLALLGETADPVTSREHVFLSAILDDAARNGVDLSLADIVRRVQKPPFSTVGVLEVDTFYAPNDRLKLALRLNNLLASPGFAAWMHGDPLEVGALLTAPDGRPRLSILNLAHLSDAERMFVVTLLAGEVVAWMRQQKGTQSLRALLFIDEVTGFIPPVANPPSKPPLMTLFKQARAFGLGVVLASQNPVDVDYKALSNAGTWLLGRLQTARDRDRVVAGLDGVVDGKLLDAKLASLPKRSFFIHSVHLPAPVVVTSRTTLTYLPGPLTPPQIKAITSASPSAPTSSTPSSPVAAASRVSVSGEALPSKYDNAVYVAAQLVTAELFFADKFTSTSETRRFVLVDGDDHAVDARVKTVPIPAAAKTRGVLPIVPDEEKQKADVLKKVLDTVTLSLKREPHLDVSQAPGEPARSFMDRVVLAAREEGDRQKDVITQKFRTKLDKLEARRDALVGRRDDQKQRASQEKMELVADVSETVFGALFGRKSFSATTVRRASRAVKQSGKADAAADKADAYDDELLELHTAITQMEHDLQTELAMKQASSKVTLEERTLKPDRKSSRVVDVAWVWAPVVDGKPAW